MSNISFNGPPGSVQTTFTSSGPVLGSSIPSPTLTSNVLTTSGNGVTWTYPSTSTAWGTTAPWTGQVTHSSFPLFELKAKNADIELLNRLAGFGATTLSLSYVSFTQEDGEIADLVLNFNYGVSDFSQAFRMLHSTDDYNVVLKYPDIHDNSKCLAQIFEVFNISLNYTSNVVLAAGGSLMSAKMKVKMIGLEEHSGGSVRNLLK